MADTLFYPSVSTLLPLERIPPNLGFIQGVLQDVFDNIFYRDLQVQKTKLGEAGFYQLSLVLYKRLGVEIPGTGGAALVLNPGQVSGQTSEIPIALSYRWEILKYLPAFEPSAPAELPRLLFDAFVEISGANAAALLAELIDRFHGASADPVQAFVDAYNLDYVPAVPLAKLNSTDPQAVIEDLLVQFGKTQKVDVYALIFASYLDVATSVEGAFADVAAFFGKWVKNLSIQDFQAFLLPHCSVAIRNIDLALEFPRSLLKPIDANGEVIDATSTLPEEQKRKSRLTFNAGSLTYSTDTGLEFDALNTFDFSPSQIADTGITLGFTGMKLDLSRTKNIPEATADGRPLDFVGVYVQQATIGLPKKWFGASSSATAADPKIVGTDIVAGSGGLSGKIGFDAAGVLHAKLGNFEASLDAFDLRFERNAIIESNISGTLTVPGFKDAAGNADAVISIKAHIGQGGDFSVTATEPNGILLKIPDVLDFKIYTLGFGREDDRFFLATSGTVTLTFAIPGLTFDRPMAVDVKELIVWEDGRIEIKGGTIILPQALTLKIGPVKLSVTAISMGSCERNGHAYRSIGFDGGVSAGAGAVDVRASGVTVYWRTDGPPLDIFLRVGGIAVAMSFPIGKSADDAAVLISGFLQVKEPDPGVAGSTAGTEYAGGISLALPRIGIRASAAMRLNPSIPAFIIDAELSLSVPILIANTNLAFYTFRVMIGSHYVADRAYIGLAPDADWYAYYKKKVPLSYKEGVNIDKFAPRSGFSVAVGTTIGTAGDSGQKFSAKLLLLLSLPEGLFLQGQAAIMSQRVDLRDNPEPPFSVLIAVTRQSMEAAFGVSYKLPEDTGAILDLEALIEMAFYYNDSSAWRINVGREDKRVMARLLGGLFTGWSYLMLSASGIKAGAGAGWGFDKGFGPVRLEAHVYLDTQGHISSRPTEIGGVILMGGSVGIRIFRFKFGLSLAAALAAEAPKPFIVTGSVSVSLELPRPIKKLGGTFTLQFTWTFDSSLNTTPVPLFNDVDVSEAVKAVNLATRERFDLNVPAGNASGSALPPPPTSGWRGNFDDFVIPLDCAVDVEFKKPIAPAAGVTNIGMTGTGYDNTELVPPQRGKSPQVEHRYVVQDVKIRSWNPTTGQWDDYDIYAALTPLQHAPFIQPASLIGLKQGWWQLDQPRKVNKLTLLAQTALHYANDVAGPFVPENSGVTAETIFCPAAPIHERCFVVDEVPSLKVLKADQRYAFEDIQVRAIGKDAQLAPFLNPFGLTKGLALTPNSRVEFFLPETAARVTLRLATLSDKVTVLYQARRQTGVNSSRQPVYGYVTVKQEVLDAVHLLKPIDYQAVEAPIDKVVIIAGPCTFLDGPSVGADPAAGQWPPTGPTSPPADPPPRGSLAAYLANVLAAAQQQLNALQNQYQQLIAQANEYESLAQQLHDNPCCDPTLPTRYHQMAQEQLAAAAALQPAIASLTAFIVSCQQLGQSTTTNAQNSGQGSTAGGSGGLPLVGNIGPRFDYTCLSFLFGLCWFPQRDQTFNSTIPSFSTLLANNKAMVTAIENTIEPIWRANAIYAVSIGTLDTVSVQGSVASATPKYMHFGFRTRGPLGHSHTYRAEYNALKAQDRADEYRLQSLKPYIDFANSYPNPDGNVLNAKPLFYVNPKLRLFYVRPYIYTMFGGQFDAYNGNAAFTSSLEVSILDPVNPLPAAPTDPGFVAPVAHEFAANELGHSNFDVQLLNNLATQGNSCTGVGRDGITPMGIQSNVSVDRLKPLKLYLAVIKANYDGDKQQLHQFTFRTSRYADFPEQVNSYLLRDRDGAFLREAVFDDIAVTLDATRATQLAALLARNYPSGDPLEQEYADPFDRLMDGILRVGPMDPPVCTDFNVVRDRATNNVIGLLLRNPEAFNNPKAPAADIDTTILLSQGNGPSTAFTAIHSKDRSRAFIGDPNLNLTLHDLEFTFTYLEYDGAAYVPASVVKVGLFTTPPLAPQSAGPAPLSKSSGSAAAGDLAAVSP